MDQMTGQPLPEETPAAPLASMPNAAQPLPPEKARALMEVYHPVTKEKFTVPQEKAYQGIIEGMYDVPADADYDVLKDNGELGGESYKIKGIELAKALKGGFTFDTPEAKAIRAYKRDNEGVIGGTKVFAASAANQALAGIPEVAAKLGASRWLPEFVNKNTLTMEEWEALHELHPGAALAGGITGFAGSLFSGPVGLLAKASTGAGALAERGLAKVIGATAAEQVGTRTAAQAAKEIVAKMGGAAVEGATFMIPQAATEAVLGDPEAAAESLKMGGLIGGAFGGASMLGSKLIKEGQKLISPERIETAGQAISETGKSALQVATGINRDAMNKYIANPEAVNAARPLAEIADDFIQKVKSLREEGTLSSSKSREILETSGLEISSDEISKPFLKVADKLGEIAKVNPNADKALNKIMSYGASLENVAVEQGGKLTAPQIKNALGYLDSLVSYEGSKEFGLDKLVQNEIKGVRRSLDSLIKDSIPEYKAHMKELADATEVAKSVASSFKSDKGAENVLKRIMTGKDRFIEEKLSKFDEFFGTNYVDELKNSYAKQAFEKETTQGTRKAFTYGSAGAGIGGGFAGPVGALAGTAIGAAVGAAADKFGTAWAKKALDVLRIADERVTEATGKLQGVKPWLDDLQKSGKTKAAAIMPLNQIFGTKEHYKNDDEAIEKIREKASQFVANPEMLQKQISQYTTPLQDAGAHKVAGQLNLSLQNSVKYIFDNVPKETIAQSPFAPKIKIKPAPSQVADFKNKMEVLSNPWTVLDRVKDGTLSPAHVQSLQANYPQLYNYMKMHIEHAAATSPVPLSYQKRITLGVLFGSPLDASLQPGKLVDLQNSFIAPDDGSKEKQAEIDIASQAILKTDKFQQA